MAKRESAYNLLKSKLDHGVWAPGERLPALSELGKLCGVSRTTMWKTVATLQRESLLNAIKGGAIRAGPRQNKETQRTSSEYKSAEPKKPTLLWERISARIGQELLSGRFPEKTLPGIGKMALQYHVTPQTIKKALVHLVDDGLIVPEGRRYVLTPQKRSTSQLSVFLIAESGAITADTRSYEVGNAFERECKRLGYSCGLEEFTIRDSNALIDMRKRIEKAGVLKGCVLNLWIPWSESHRRRWYDLIMFLTARKVPAIVIDQGGNFPVPDEMARNTYVRWLRIASERAGTAVADALFRRGHRRIAYLSPYFNTDWAQSRYRGLTQYARNYGGAAASVVFFALDELRYQDDLILAILDLKDDELRTLFRDQRTDAELDGLSAVRKRIGREHLPDRMILDNETSTLRNVAQSLIALAGQQHDKSVYARQLAPLLHGAINKAFESYLRPSFERALATSNATAWVCSDEKTALSALAFLRGMKIPVPQKISVVGFDNWPDSSENQLSTYDFNMVGMVQTALHLIMDERDRKNRPMISEVDGYVVERRTTKR